jgi:hypothetical protein
MRSIRPSARAAAGGGCTEAAASCALPLFRLGFLNALLKLLHLLLQLPQRLAQLRKARRPAHGLEPSAAAKRHGATTKLRTSACTPLNDGQMRACQARAG